MKTKVVYRVTIGTLDSYDTTRVSATRELKSETVYRRAAEQTGWKLSDCTRQQIDNVERL